MTTTLLQTPLELAKAMGTGWNAGQLFDNNDRSRDPAKVRPIIKAYWDKGFRHMRLPVTWYGKTTTTCRLNDTLFMSQLDNALSYAIGLGFIVILNTHHEDFLNGAYDSSEAFNGIFWRLWRDIATRYKSIDKNKLIFEVLNEPHAVFGDYSGGCCCNCTKALGYTRQINKVGYDGIRYVDADRTISLCPNAMQCYSQCGSLYPSEAALPGGGNDKHLFVSVHTYDKYEFCSNTGTNEYYNKQADPIAALRKDLDDIISTLYNWHTTVGGFDKIGLMINEYGVGCSTPGSTRRDTDLVREYYRYLARKAREKNFPIAVWSDGNYGQAWYGIERVKADGTVEFPAWLANCALGI